VVAPKSAATSRQPVAPAVKLCSSCGMPTWMDSIDNLRPHGEAAERLHDLLRVVPISLLVVAGVRSAFVAVGVLRLIGLFTNLFFQRWETGLIAPGAEATR
jgi:hypothetical protein